MTEQQSVQQNVVNSVTQAPKRFGKLKLWQKIVAGVVAVIVLLFIVVLFATSGVSNASNKFVEAILRNDATTAYQMFSSEAKTQVPQDQFKEIVSRMSSVLDDKANQTSSSVESESDSDSKGKTVYDIKGNDGDYILTVNLVKENGDWKILNFDNSRK